VLKKIVRGSALAGVGITVGSFVEYLYYFSMADMLGPAAFGLLSATISIMWILVTVLTYSVGLSVAKFISEEGGLGKIRVYVFNGLSLAFLASLVAAVFLLALVFFVIPKTALADMTTPLFLVALSMPALALSMISITLFQGLNRMGGYSSILVLNSAIKVGLAILLVYFGYGLYGAIGAYGLGALATTVIAFIVLREHVDLRQKIDSVLIKKIAFFSLPVAAVTIVVHVLLKSDVVFLKALGVSNEQIGYYTGAALLARAVYMASSSIAIAALPIISSQKTLMWRSLKKPIALIAAGFIVGNVFIALFPAQLIDLFFPIEYTQVSHLLPPLAVAMSLLSMGYIGSTTLIAVGKPYEILKPLLAGVVAYSVLITYLTPKIGLSATYTSLITANTIYLILTVFQARKHIK